ncbi:MAG: threonine/serine dehydratase [Bdellovibrionales bacterium]
MPEFLSFKDVQQAAACIAGHIVTTPLLYSPLLDKQLGFRLLVKAENVQVTGSFKVRGAFNQMAQLTDQEKKNGVIAISSGNHAQAVAYAAGVFGVKTTIVMPHDAPRLKLDNTRRYGAEVVTYNRDTEDREQVGAKLSRERGLRMIHPYNDARTIAGQGTAGIEIFEQAKARGLTADAILINCSGGGLAAGVALTRDLYGDKPPDIYTAEPDTFDEMRASLEAGKILHNQKPSGSICDALLAMSPGTHTFPILLDRNAKGLAASDICIEAAMSVAAEYFKLVLEPGGAVSLACACLKRDMFQEKTVVAVASGGNVDPEAYTAMIRRGYSNRSMILT